LTASRAASAAGHEYTATDTDLGVTVLLTLVESLDALDAEDGVPDPALQREYQHTMARLVELKHPLLGMPRRVSPAHSEAYWYTSLATGGTPLRRHLDNRGPLAWRTVALVLLEATVALATAHQRSCAHGNIGPETLLVEPNGALRFVRPNVAARVLFKCRDTSTISLAALWDEPIYLSPEVLNRSSPEPSDDIYALGVLAYELLTGRLPYGSPSEPLGRSQSRRSAPDPGELVPGLPEAMSLLVRRMLSPRTAIRTRNASALRKDLQQQILADVGPNDVRSELVAALCARVQSSPSPVKAAADALPKATASVPIDRATAERAVDQALLAAGMSTGSSQPGRTGTRRGLWLGLGLGAAVLLAVALMQPQEVAPEVTPPASLSPPAGEVALRAAKVKAEPSAAEVLTAEVQRAEAALASVDPVEVARLKAEALIGSGKVALAQRVLNRALLSVVDAKGELHMLLASTFAAEGLIKEARAAYITADGEDGQRSAGHLQAGMLAATDGRCSEALPLFAEVMARAGSSAQLLKLLGNCHFIVGDLKAAGDALKRAYVADKDDLDIVIPLAQTLEKTGDPAGARDAYRRALSLAPNDPRAREGLSRLDGSSSKAAPIVTPNLQGSPEGEEPVSLEAMEASAHAAFKQGDYSQAARLYGDAVKLVGEAASPTLLRNHAVALHKAKKLRPAVRAYEAAIEKLPKDAELHFLLGMALSAQRQDSAALSALRAALNLEPTNTKARFELGLVALRHRRHSEAAGAFEETLRRQPGNRAALQNLIKARVDGGDQQGALQALGRMHSKYPGDAQTLLTMAALLQRMDRDDEAEALLKNACTKGIKEACQ
jgi:tetratricopeptide (TPR) repeat protein